MKTTPDMDAKIVGILRTSEEPHCQYAALLIEELQAGVVREPAPIAASTETDLIALCNDAWKLITTVDRSNFYYPPITTDWKAAALRWQQASHSLLVSIGCFDEASLVMKGE